MLQALCLVVSMRLVVFDFMLDCIGFALGLVCLFLILGFEIFLDETDTPMHASSGNNTHTKK